MLAFPDTPRVAARADRRRVMPRIRVSWAVTVEAVSPRSPRRAGLCKLRA
jgi:hypothetical protein